MNYKGEWEAKGLTGATDSMLVLLFLNSDYSGEPDADERLAGTLSFYAKETTEVTNIMVVSAENGIHFVTQPPTARGYTASFIGTAIDDDTIKGTLNYGIYTDRTEEEVTFTRKTAR